MIDGIIDKYTENTELEQNMGLYWIWLRLGASYRIIGFDILHHIMLCSNRKKENIGQEKENKFD